MSQLTERQIARLREQSEKPLPKPPNADQQRREDSDRMRRYEQDKSLKREW